MSTATIFTRQGLKQRKKGAPQLTFEEIAPRWAKRVHLYGADAFRRYRKSLELYGRCVVGESHIHSGGDADYGFCDTCERMGYRFARSRDPMKYIPSFVNHWNARHVQRAAQ